MTIRVVSKDGRHSATVEMDDDGPVIRYYWETVGFAGKAFWKFERETHPKAPFHAALDTAYAVIHAPPKIGAAARH